MSSPNLKHPFKKHKKLLFKDSFTWKDKTIIQKWYSHDPSNIKKYGSVRVYVLQKNKLLLAKKYDNTFQIPGGHIEKNESLQQTAIRELLEETNIKVKENDLVPICFLESFEKTNQKNKTYEMHYFINAQKIKSNTFTKDPANKIVGNKFVKLNELNKYLKWGKKADFIKQLLLATSYNKDDKKHD